MVPHIVRKYQDIGEYPIKFGSFQDYHIHEMPDEIVIATSVTDGASPISEDMRNTAYIAALLKDNIIEKQVRVHMLTHTPDIMSMMQTWDLEKSIQDKVEIYPFSFESLWAGKITCPSLTKDSDMPPLDREPVGKDSDKCVHLVIFGMNAMAQEIAKHAALVCHFPNYTRDHSLRTRITIVDSHIDDAMGDFVGRHEHLFANSFHRFIDLANTESNVVKSIHKPQFHGTREDFIDVEWEFVKGGINSEILRQKLGYWAASDRQQLTVVLCNDDVVRVFDLEVLFGRRLQRDLVRGHGKHPFEFFVLLLLLDEVHGEAGDDAHDDDRRGGDQPSGNAFLLRFRFRFRVLAAVPPGIGLFDQDFALFVLFAHA